MNDAYWDSVFAQFKQAIEKEGGILPSVSVIAERENDPFRVLIATIISLRTKDEVTLDASTRLFTLAKDPEHMLNLSEEEIQKAIYPAGFYKTKARNIRAICTILLEHHGGVVPNERYQYPRASHGLRRRCPLFRPKGRGISPCFPGPRSREEPSC
jgi:endonuclease-3